MENALRKVIERLILPKFPEVKTYVINASDVFTKKRGTPIESKTTYNLYFGINADISIERARELYEDSYSLFNMLAFDNSKLKVFTTRVMDGMSI
jgi:hypothetical protein